jgi:long-chain acyl-CoA synthetase
VEAFFACWHAGLAAVPVNAKLHARELAYILEHSDAKLAIVAPDLVETIHEACRTAPGIETVLSVENAGYMALLDAEPLAIEARAPDDLGWLFYTSGTTGRPKGAMISHRNLAAMCACYFMDVDGIDPGDCIIHVAPMSHGSGIYGLPHVAAAAKQVIPESGGFEPGEIFALLRAHRGATLFAAPTMVRRLTESPEAADADTTNLKTIAYGGGPMYLEDLRKALKRFGDKLVQVYGQGESPMTITALSRARHAETDHPRYEARLASAGTAQSLVEVRVADEEDRTLPAGELGQVLVRGDSVIGGYWKDAAATARALAGGWLHTGDIGFMDEDGFLTLKDRSTDMIISGGTNIYPREVEEVLLAHPGVAEAAVVGRPHADWGEEVVAFVVARPGADVAAAALDALCLENIARFKRPRDYRFVESLPKNNYGKVLKRALREMLA